MKEISYSRNSKPTLGVLISHFRGQYQLELVKGIESEARKRDANIITFAGRYIHSPIPGDAYQNIIYDIISPHSLDGVIITSVLSNYATNEEMEAFIGRFASIPRVTFNYTGNSAPSLRADNATGFSSLIGHLIEAHGYRKMAFVSGPRMNPDAAERLSVFNETLARHGISSDPRCIVDGDFSFSGGRAAVSALLDERDIGPGEIDAIIAASDLMALGVIDALVSRGIRVPGDIAVTGFDDIPDAATSAPTLSTVRQPAFEIGRLAVARLLDPEPAYDNVLLETAAILRASCGCSNPEKVGIPSPESLDPIGNESSDTQTKPVSESFIYQLIYVSDALRESQTLGELGAWMRASLPELGIYGCCLFLYEGTANPPESFSLITGYNVKGELPRSVLKKYTWNELMGFMAQTDTRYSCCILPLVYRGTQFGFLLLDVNLNAWIAYESIRSQISSCLKSIFLLDEIGRVNRDLEKANKKLRVSDIQKTRFFINIAHDTKTPLTLVKNYLEKYIRAHEPDPDLSIVKQNIDILLLNMINFLDAKKLELGKLTYNHEQAIDLSTLVSDKIVLFREYAAKKEMTLLENVAQEVYVRADPWAIDRVLNNLLDNAVKYGKQKGTIRVDLVAGKPEATLSVSDDGPGIDPERIGNIYKPFYQLSHEKSGRQGIGMGLYIVRKILDSIGWQIDVRNVEGGGACFSIVCKVCEKEAAKDDRIENFVVSTPLVTLPDSAPINHVTVSKDKYSLLVVDDNPAMLAFLDTSLRVKYNVFTATGVKEAFLRLDTMPVPEVIVSDVMMDDIDGHAFLDALSADERFSNVPFIFLTAKHDQGDKLAGLAKGAIDYIEKPFSIDELSEKIGTIIELRKRQRNAEASKLKKSIIDFLSPEGRAPSEQEYFAIERICMERKLTIREREVVRLMLKGLVNKEIAAGLNIALRTAEFHIINVYKKLGINDRHELYVLFNSSK
jgi:DNA-binding LacI/PurR family transcriptional regulator/signal transduction histidine kinase/DNA-binding NarL/FixJ family response regulator